MRNFADGSDAYTYVKPHVKKDNTRMDVKALSKRYENAGTQEKYINKVKRTLEFMTYQNERAMKFEKFVTGFVKAVDDLEKHECGMHNADVVDLIWKKITNPHLSQYVTELKVQFQREPREYKDILQDIASQVPNLRVDTFRKFSEVGRHGNDENSRCPSTSAHDANRKLYTGTYPYKKWQIESVRPHWQQIRDAREGNHKRRGR